MKTEPTVDFDTMISQADDAVETLTPWDVQTILDGQGDSQGDSDEHVLLVDIRDIRELEREGRIPGSTHVPRGMLEFWIHPDSPYFKDYFDAADRVILHCNRGWRSALAAKALQDIGLEVAHMSGGYSEWVKLGLATETVEKRR